MDPAEKKEFIEQAAETVVPAKTEPEMVYGGDTSVPEGTPTPAVEPVKPDVSLEQKLAEMQQKIDGVTKENEELKYNKYMDTQTQVPTVEAAPTGVPDMYTEPAAFDAYVEKLATKKAEELSKPLLDRVQNVELIQGENLYNQGVKDCKEQFPNFDINIEGVELQKIMQQKNVSLVEAKKLKEFDSMQDKMKQLESGVVERLNTPQTTTTTAATHTVTDKQVITLPTLDADQKAYAARRGMDEKTYATMIYKTDAAKGEMPV